MRAPLQSWLAPVLFACSALATNCYRPNGDLVQDLNYAPCHKSATASGSMCCNLNRALFPDTCTSEGLCRNGDDVFRDSCTDPTWKSPECVQLCTTGVGRTGLDVGDPKGKDFLVPFLTQITMRKKDLLTQNINSGQLGLHST